MTLDAHAQGLLEAMAAQGLKDFSEMDVAEARETALAFIDLQGEPEPATVSDRQVPGPEGDVPVRVYRPDTGSDGPQPVVVYIHGGGWVIGDIEVADKPCRSLANATGATVVSVGTARAPSTASRRRPRTATRPRSGSRTTPPNSTSTRARSPWPATARAGTWPPSSR